MPYIERIKRNLLLPNSQTTAMVPGELNYQITCLIVGFMLERGISYTTINDILGALEGAKLEFQRRVVGPYEDAKIRLNGDVYPRMDFGNETTPIKPDIQTRTENP